MGYLKDYSTKINETITEVLITLKNTFKLLVTPQAIEIQKNKEERTFTICVSIVCIFILNISLNIVTEQTLKNSIFIFIMLILNVWLSLFAISIILKIKNPCFIALVLSILECFIRLIQIISQILFIHTEQYFFYFLMVIIALLGTLWMCFYVPIRFKRKVFRKILACFFSLTLFTTINGIVFMVIHPDIKDESSFLLPWDPIFSEAELERESIYYHITSVTEKMPTICEYTGKNITNKQYKDLIISACTNLLTSKEEIERSLESVKFKRTREIYKELVDIMELVTQIKGKTQTILDVDENLDEKINKLQEEVEKNIAELNSFDKFIQETESRMVTNTDTGTKYFRVTPEFELEIKKYGLTIEKIKNNDMAYFNNKVENVCKEIEKNTFEIEKLKHKVIIITEITELIINLTQQEKELITLYQDYVDYYEWRIKVLNTLFI